MQPKCAEKTHHMVYTLLLDLSSGIYKHCLEPLKVVEESVEVRELLPTGFLTYQCLLQVFICTCIIHSFKGHSLSDIYSTTLYSTV